MRVTNLMTTNQLLLNLHKSMNSLNYLQYQSTTGNKIRYASDNPIIAGRSLKFRTNIVETEQFISNVDQGRSWMQTSANAVKNIIEAFSSASQNSIRTLLVGAGGTNTITDCKIFSNQLRETLEEIKSELNASYAGRYVFSGFKTDEKPILDTDSPARVVDITQTFTEKDVQAGYKVYTKGGDALSMPEEISCNRLKLAYDGGISDVYVDGTLVTSEYLSTDPGAYEPGSGEIYFIKDTGELIFGDEVTADFSVTYTKTGFNAGEINPKAYFTCVENGETSIIDGQYMMYEFGINNKMAVNTLGKDLLTTSLLNDINDVVKLVDGITLSDKDELINKFMTVDSLSYEDAEKRAEAQLDDENKFYMDILGDKFTTLIGKVDKHSVELSKENTSIGARLQRLDLVYNRLQDDRINYEDLKSQNDFVDAEEVYTRFMSMLAVYQSALKTGAQISQMSLVNYV